MLHVFHSSIKCGCTFFFKILGYAQISQLIIVDLKKKKIILMTSSSFIYKKYYNNNVI